MKVKIDTKEKFNSVTLSETVLTAAMTEELSDTLIVFLEKSVKNVVLIMTEVSEMDIVAAEKLVTIQQQFYENGASFVICNLQNSVLDFLDKNELLEMMNVTPTESEAWDIVQMEEMEREMFGDDDAAN
ncbi:MAG: STAS domain-containing protein [Bacteroidetes bacterium]|nr:STAS domain-containing protein [Bacteroidota bacterium]